MRKLGRMIRRVLTAVSLLLFVAVLAAWVRGYFRSDTTTFWIDTSTARECHINRWEVEWGGGDIGVRRMWLFADLPKVPPNVQEPWGLWIVSSPPVDTHILYSSDARRWKKSNLPETWEAFGMMSAMQTERAQTDVRGLILDAYAVERLIAFPCWMAAIVFGALPSWRGVHLVAGGAAATVGFAGGAVRGVRV